MISSKLNRTIVIEKAYPSVNAVGSPITVWSEHITTYTNMYTPSSDTRFTQNGELFSSRTEFIVRYNENTKILNNKYRIKYGSDYYKILQVSEMGVKDGIKIIAVNFDDGE